MIVGTGIDVVSISRFAQVLQRRPSVGTRLFTDRELTDDDGRRRSATSLAARFAAKEAVAKALDAPAGLAWHDCEILTTDSGRPAIEVSGSVHEAAHERGIRAWHVSLSHDADIAIAQVIAVDGAG